MVGLPPKISFLPITRSSTVKKGIIKRAAPICRIVAVDSYPILLDVPK